MSPIYDHLLTRYVDFTRTKVYYIWITRCVCWQYYLSTALKVKQRRNKSNQCICQKYSLSTALTFITFGVPLSKVFSIDCTGATERWASGRLVVPLSKVFSIDCTKATRANGLVIGFLCRYRKYSLSTALWMNCKIKPKRGSAVIESILYRLHWPFSMPCQTFSAKCRYRKYSLSTALSVLSV